MDPQGIRDTESRSGHSTGSFCIPPEDHHHRDGQSNQLLRENQDEIRLDR